MGWLFDILGELLFAAFFENVVVKKWKEERQEAERKKREVKSSEPSQADRPISN